MLTVLEPCDSEYRVRALLLRPRQGVTSLLIGDIRVPAAASYPQFRSLLFFSFFNLFTSPLPSLSLSLSCSLSLGSALISSRQPPSPPPPPPPPSPPLVCISSGGAVQEQPHVPVRQGEGEREGDGRREQETQLMLHHGATSRHLGPSSSPP